MFEVKPRDEVNEGREFDFGSPYVFALLAGKFWETLAKHGKGENPRYTEWFEAMAILRLSEGGTFKIKELGKHDAEFEDLALDKVPIETFAPTNGKEVDNEGFYRAWGGLTAGAKMLTSKWGTLPVVDCADRARRGYNMTVTRTHGIEYEQCKNILHEHDRVTGNLDNLELYFAVPE